jgi:hypothetical protein
MGAINPSKMPKGKVKKQEKPQKKPLKQLCKRVLRRLHTHMWLLHVAAVVAVGEVAL